MTPCLLKSGITDNGSFAEIIQQRSQLKTCVICIDFSVVAVVVVFVVSLVWFVFSLKHYTGTVCILVVMHLHKI